eukprot:CAMPEP_0181323186 /NCGR_PEP_ID=MMETSP1101-20121128/19641_1 /TAXON_ID=46948 /ORGANISM="Rhodomonas abbreviata, Strain Caron Lab Isolate" /LENGTH=78 /DNA_ID=CAMNT_0023431177 /DNA_START=45 /DNA_END=281 /DNA_ORIENTATION=+
MLGEMVLGLAVCGAVGLVAVDGAYVASFFMANYDRPPGQPDYFKKDAEGFVNADYRRAGEPMEEEEYEYEEDTRQTVV